MEILKTLIQARPSGIYTITVEPQNKAEAKVVVRVTSTLDQDGKTLNLKIESLEGLY